MKCLALSGNIERIIGAVLKIELMENSYPQWSVPVVNEIMTERKVDLRAAYDFG